MTNLIRPILLLLGVFIIKIEEAASALDDQPLSVLIDAADMTERIKDMMVSRVSRRIHDDPVTHCKTR